MSESVRPEVQYFQNTVARMHVALAQWKLDDDNPDALHELQSVFNVLRTHCETHHDRPLGEVAWSVSNLLSRLVEGTIEPSPELVSLLDEVVECTSNSWQSFGQQEAREDEVIDELLERIDVCASGGFDEDEADFANPEESGQPGEADATVEVGLIDRWNQLEMALNRSRIAIERTTRAIRNELLAAQLTTGSRQHSKVDEPVRELIDEVDSEVEEIVRTADEMARLTTAADKLTVASLIEDICRGTSQDSEIAVSTRAVVSDCRTAVMHKSIAQKLSPLLSNIVRRASVNRQLARAESGDPVAPGYEPLLTIRDRGDAFTFEVHETRSSIRLDAVKSDARSFRLINKKTELSDDELLSFALDPRISSDLLFDEYPEGIYQAIIDVGGTISLHAQSPMSIRLTIGVPKYVQLRSVVPFLVAGDSYLIDASAISNEQADTYLGSTEEADVWSLESGVWKEVSSAEASIPSERLQVRSGAKEIRLAVESLPPRKEVVTPDSVKGTGGYYGMTRLDSRTVGLLLNPISTFCSDASVLSQLSRTGCPYILVLDPTATIGARWLPNLRHLNCEYDLVADLSNLISLTQERRPDILIVADVPLELQVYKYIHSINQKSKPHSTLIYIAAESSRVVTDMVPDMTFDGYVDVDGIEAVLDKVSERYGEDFGR